MGRPIADDYAWFDEQYGDSLGTAFCITFVRGLTPAEAFQRLDVTVDETIDRDNLHDHPITASVSGGGTVLIEPNGFAPTRDTVAGRLSADTDMAAVFLNVNAHQQFVYAAYGQVVTRFETDGPDSRMGADPDRLLSHMVELGMPVDDADPDDDSWGDPILTAFALAERVTGVRLTLASIDDPTLVGSAASLY